jgi:uncharacterized protein
MKFILLLFLIAVVSFSCSQREIVKESEHNKMTNMDSYKLISGIVKDTFVIDISLPYSYSKNINERYPVFYMTDGYWRREQHQPIHELAVNEKIKEMIVVSIGYPERYNPNEVRKRDLLSGADKFLDFILQELIPYVENNYRTNGERTLWGSSFGGYFAMYTLFQYAVITRDVFQNYIVASPAAFQTTKFEGKDLNLLEYEELLFEKTNEVKANLYLTVGGNEASSFTDSFNYLNKILSQRKYKNFYMKSFVDPGKDHFTVWEPTLFEGIRMFCKK